MSGIGPKHLGDAVARIRIRFDTAEAELNAADARLGDGDTGAMLKRMAEQLATVEIDTLPTVSATFQALALRATSSTGSSLGTLISTALLVFARESKPAPTLEFDQLPHILELAIAAMSARGGAKPGDKTIIDGLLAVAAALGTSPSSGMAAAARAAARAALDHFRDQPNRIGRAGRYGDRSRGLDDPGMLALFLLCDALASQETP